MAARLKIIKIPRTPATAFDQHRPASDLVQNQVRHAYQELHAWWERIGSTTPEQIETEQQAADYLNAVTRVLHPEATARTQLPGNRQKKSGVVLGSQAPSPRRASRRKPRTSRR
jgi:hypothetical protein